jgi:hypothetical protein
VTTFRIDYQRVESGPPYPSAIFHAKTSTGSPWVARTLSQCHPWSTMGCRPTQRPSTLLSLRDPINPVCISTQLNACCNRAQPMRSLIDTGGDYHLGAPNLTSNHSHHSHPVVTAIETSPELHCGQGVLHGALWTLHYDHVDMHNLNPTIEEVIAFTKWLSDKQISAKRAVWNLGYMATFGLLKQLSPQLQNLWKFAHLYIMTSVINSILEVKTNSA